MKVSHEAKEILNILNSNGYKAYFVGGAVRDLLLGNNPNDYDITTNAQPETIEKIFNKTILTGKKHGTVTVIFDNNKYEITTFRIDGEYLDGRRPDKIIYTNSLKEDLERRDFTINAMAMDKDLNIYDYFNGRNDLETGLIRTVGNPEDRFNEDKLRKIRAVRFACQLKFKIEEQTLKVLCNNPEIINISSDRIRNELNRILLCEKPSEGIRLLLKVSLLDQFIPELLKCVDFQQYNPRHNKDVFNHIMEVLDNVPINLTLRLAALFHDIGKPQSYSKDKKGIGHFYGHEILSCEIAEKIMKRLNYSINNIKDVKLLIKYHMNKDKKMKESTLKKIISDIGEDKIDQLFELQLADLKGRVENDIVEEVRYNHNRVKKIINNRYPIRVKDLSINGKDLLRIGLNGKEIGSTLHNLLMLVHEKPELNNRTSLLSVIKDKKDDMLR